MRTKRLFFKRYISYRKTQESRFVCANNTQKPNVSICFYLVYQILSITETKKASYLVSDNLLLMFS